MNKKAKVSIAEYVEMLIALSPKSQKEIAEECGYEKPNILTMIKQGRSKLPINKVGVLATALGVDPVHMLRMTMNEYMPETWQVIESIAGDTLVSKEELAALKALRAATDGFVIDYSRADVKAALQQALKPIVDAEIKDNRSAVESTRKTRTK